jgi:hypothetical protein
MPEFVQILAYTCLCWVLINFLVRIYFSIKDQQEDEEELLVDENWIFPIHLEYTNDMWYAWDIDNTFIRQASSKEQLITDILNQYDISPRRIEIKSEKLLNETAKAAV